MKIACLAITFFLILTPLESTSFLTGSIVEAENPETSLKVKRPVGVYVHDKNGKEVASGDGFVEKNWVISTNCNIILKWLEDVEHTLSVKTEKGDYFPIEKLVYYNRRKNIALFRVESKAAKGEMQIAVIPKMPLKPDIDKKVIKIPDDAEMHFHRGLTYHESKNYKRAAEEYRNALTVKPDHLDSYVNLGMVYYKLGRYPEAVDIYKQAIKIKPDFNMVYNKLGTLYIILGEFSPAIDVFEQALSIDPRNPDTHYNLGLVYFLSGDKDAALEEYIILNKIDKERADNLFDVIYR
jgi:tetratricopeptide (TPR) repeat protein